MRFTLDGEDLHLVGPDGESFLEYQELVAQRREALEQAARATERAGKAEQRAGQAEHRAGEAEQRAARLAAQLRAAGIEPAAG